jgi:hypothetical protein
MDAVLVLLSLLFLLGGASLIVLKAWVNNKRYEKELIALVESENRG